MFCETYRETLTNAVAAGFLKTALPVLRTRPSRQRCCLASEKPSRKRVFLHRASGWRGPGFPLPSSRRWLWPPFCLAC